MEDLRNYLKKTLSLYLGYEFKGRQEWTEEVVQDVLVEFLDWVNKTNRTALLMRENFKEAFNVAMVIARRRAADRDSP